MTITSEGIDQRPELELLATTCRRIFSTYNAHVSDVLATPGGVQLRLTDKNHATVVQPLLYRLGYAVHTASAAEQQALVVTGWSFEALARRASRTEDAVRQLSDEIRQISKLTLHAFLAYVTTYGYSEDDALEETVKAARRNAATRLTSLGQPFDVVTDDDIRHAPAESARLLHRIRASQQALEQAEHEHAQRAASAVERFQHLREQSPGQLDETLIEIVHNENGE